MSDKKDSTAQERYWRFRAALEVVKLGLWTAFKAVEEIIRG